MTLTVFTYTEHEIPIDPSFVDGAESHLYAVEILGSGVKVGITKDPRARIKTHERAARAHGLSIGRICLSGPHENARSNEAVVVRHFNPSGRSEYLTAPFDEVVKRMEGLAFHRADPVAVAARAESVTNLFKALVLGGSR